MRTGSKDDVISENIDIYPDRTAPPRFHKLILQFDGQGSYAFGPLEWKKRLALQEEKQSLEHKLLEIPKLEARLAELEGRN